MDINRNITLVNFIKYGLFFCLLIPLITPINLWYPFIFGKTIIFEIAVDVLFLAYLILLLRDSSFLPRRNSLLYGILIFIFILILSTVFSANLYRSFWGSIARMDGLFSILHFFIFFILVSSILKNKKDWFQILMFSCGVSFVAAFLNLDRLGISFFGKLHTTIFNPTMGSTFPLAGYLLFHIFLALFLLFWKTGFASRVFLGLVLILDTLILFSTNSQSAFLGLIIGLLIFIIWIGIKHPYKKIRIIILTAFLASVVILGLVFIFKETALIKNSSVYSLINFSIPKLRLLAWDIAFEGILEKPIFGWGLSNYSIPFNVYYNPEFFQLAYFGNWWDKPHNMLLDIGSSSGFLGMLSYLSLFLLIFFAIFKNKNLNISTQGALYGLFSAYFIQNFFMFDTFSTYLIFFFLFSFTSYLDFKEESGEEKKFLPKLSNNLSTFLTIFLICLFFVFCYSVYNNNIQAAHFAAKGDGYWSGGGYSLARDNFKKALSFDSFGKKEIRIELAKLILSPSQKTIQKEGVTKEQMLADLEFIALELEKSRRDYHLEVDDRMLLGSVYEKTAKMGKSDILEKAEEPLEEALKINPNRQQVYYVYAQIKGLKGKNDEMIGLLEKAVSLDPELYLSHWHLGWGYLTVGETEKGLLEIEKAIDLGYSINWILEKPNFVLTLIDNYIKVENYEKIIFWYEQLLKTDSQNAQYWASLAVAYAQSGNKEKAEFCVNKAVELDPKIKKEAEEFLRTIK